MHALGRSDSLLSTYFLKGQDRTILDIFCDYLRSCCIRNIAVVQNHSGLRGLNNGSLMRRETGNQSLLPRAGKVISCMLK
jgi:hypothetical protein